MKSECGHPLYWHNCYSGGFALWSEEAYGHPAKMSPALCYRILGHLQELGLLKEGDTILDPMAGIGTTNICAGAMGYSSISVELEEKFINFEEQNKEYAERRLFKSLDWKMIQGDSRNLSGLLQESGLKSVTSPPYAGREEHRLGYPHHQKDEQRGYKPYKGYREGYGDNPENIGSLKDVPLKSITSPPYEQSITGGKSGIEWQEEWGKPSESRQPSQDISYGDSKENIGNFKDLPLKSVMSPPYLDALNPPHDVDLEAKRLEIARQKGISPDKVSHLDYTKKDGSLKAVTSPPYSEAQSGGGIAQKGYQGKKHSPTDLVGQRSYMPEVHGQSEGQIGNLPDKPLKSVMSPPDDNRMRNEGNPSDAKHRIWPHGAEKYDATYPTSEGQIGNEKSESYLEAMTRVYFEIASVSDCLTIVIKNPTRAGKLRRLDLDTIKILEMSGWRIHCQHRALLFEELEQGVMIGETDMLVPDLSRAVEQPRFGYRMVITPAEDDEDYKEFVLEYPKLKPNTTYYAPQVPSGTIGIDGKRVKGRLSFFKRLSYIKGQPVASWEDILICVRK